MCGVGGEVVWSGWRGERWCVEWYNFEFFHAQHRGRLEGERGRLRERERGRERGEGSFHHSRGIQVLLCQAITSISSLSETLRELSYCMAFALWPRGLLACLPLHPPTYPKWWADRWFSVLITVVYLEVRPLYSISAVSTLSHSTHL